MWCDESPDSRESPHSSQMKILELVNWVSFVIQPVIGMKGIINNFNQTRLICFSCLLTILQSSSKFYIRNDNCRKCAKFFSKFCVNLLLLCSVRRVVKFWQLGCEMEKCSQNSKVELVARPRLAKFIKKKHLYKHTYR